MSQLELDLEAYKLLEARRECVGESQLDILKRCLKPGATKHPAPSPGASRGPERHTGAFVVRVGKRDTIGHSQKAAYKQVLL